MLKMPSPEMVLRKLNGAAMECEKLGCSKLKNSVAYLCNITRMNPSLLVLLLDFCFVQQQHSGVSLLLER
jgi:hypothetical protein